MGLSDTRDLLRSNRQTVAVEAAAGCGKTHEAALLASDLSGELGLGQEVLVLAHTNAAVNEFRSRLRIYGARARALTLDAFALELVAAFARPLGVREPIEIGDVSGFGFDRLAPLLGELLRRAPSLVRLLAHHYPIIVLDEHQDCRVEQHRTIATLLAGGPVRARFFGDPMQAIYGFGIGGLVDWSDLYASVDARAVLDEPQRWPDAPALGQWLVACRAVFQRKGSLALSQKPKEVQVLNVPDLSRWNPRSEACPVSFVTMLNSLLGSRGGSLAVLTQSNANAYGIRLASLGRLRIYEGADFPIAQDAVAQAAALQGNARSLSLAVLSLLKRTCTGITKKVVDDCAASLTDRGLTPGRKTAVLPLLKQLEPLYEEATLGRWSQVVRRIREEPTLGMKVHRGDTLRIAGSLDLSDGVSPQLALERAIQASKDLAGMPLRFTTTIHKAKGHEVDHVIVAPVTKAAFKDSEEARRLLYVAMSRARKSVTLVQDPKAPSPLLVA